MNSQIVKTFNDVVFSITKEGESIWFWGKEVADVVGYTNPSKAIKDHVEDDDKRKVQKATEQNVRLLSLNQKSMSWQINECGLYSLVFSSKLPLAKDFKKWVFKDVLPSIRKTGQYKTVKHNQLSIMSERDLRRKGDKKEIP